MTSSFLIKGGYDAFRKQIVNISLKKTNNWKQGVVIVNNKELYRLQSNKTNYLELIKINNLYTLTTNGGFIYENTYPFIYDIELTYNKEVNDYSKNNFYNCYNNNIIKYSDIPIISNNFRQLN